MTEATFVVSKLHEEYRDKKKKLFICFVDIEKAFDSFKRGGDERFTRGNCKSSDEPP